MTRPTGRPTGRPPKIDQVLRRHDDGRVETVADRIAAHVRAGGYIEEAAAACDVSKQAVYEWLKIGARAQVHLASGKPRRELTRHQLRCAEFNDAVASCDAIATMTDVALTAKLAAGVERTITTLKLDSNGNELERTTRVESAIPDGAMIRWRLERRKPHQWGRLQRIEISGLEGGPVQLETDSDMRERLNDMLDDIGHRLAAAPEADTPAIIDVGEVHQLEPAPDA